MNMPKSRLLALAAAHGASLLAVPAVLAAGPTTGQIEEIVVTARQRAERIEDVPASITAFTATDIRNAGIERPQDFIALTPGVAQVQTAEVGDMQVTIRGINTGRDAESNFALVVDGVLQTNVNALNQELNGVTQIEILKGPQGALYGRNALAGAVIVTTRKPGDAFEAEVGGGYGSDNTYTMNAYVGGPLSERTRAGISAYYRNQDGQWENDFLDCDDCVDYLEDKGATVRVLRDVGDNGVLDFKARYSEVKAGAINFNAAFALPAFTQIPVIGHPGFFEDSNDHDFKYINNIKPDNEQENLNLSVKGDWQLDYATVTGVLALNRQDNNFITDGASPFGQYRAEPNCIATNDAIFFGDPDLDPINGTGVIPRPGLVFPTAGTGGEVGSILPPYDATSCGGYQYQERNQDDMSFELRLTSPGEQRMRWVAGLYLADIERDVTVSTGSDRGLGLEKKGFVPTGGPNPTDQLYDDTFESKVFAIFGQLAYDVVEDVEVALALRYDTEDRSVDNHVDRLPAQTPEFCDVPGAFGTVSAVCPDSRVIYINPAYNIDPTLTQIRDRSESFSQIQPKLTVNWKLADGWAVFASYGYGFRSGGFNSSGSQATVEAYLGGLTTADGSQPAIQNVSDEYDKEVSKAAEIGFKAELLDRSVTLSGALFHTDLEDMQFFNFFAGPFGLLRVVTNIDNVQIDGFELNGRWRTTDWMTLFGGVGYVDGEIEEYKSRPYTEGNAIPYAPEYTANVGADFQFPISNALSLVARVDGSFVGETWFHPVQDDSVFTLFGAPGDYSKTKRDPYNVFNARIGVRADNWSVTAWTKNFTDENYLAENITAPEFGGSFIHDSPGISYGLDVNFKF